MVQNPSAEGFSARPAQQFGDLLEAGLRSRVRGREAVGVLKLRIDPTREQ